MQTVRGRAIQEQIKAYRKQGKTYGQIGIIFGISKQRVERIEKYDYKQPVCGTKCVYPKVKKWIIENNYSIYDLARLFNCKIPRLRAMLSGRARPNLNDIIVLERHMGKGIEEIIK